MTDDDNAYLIQTPVPAGRDLTARLSLQKSSGAVPHAPKGEHGGLRPGAGRKTTFYSPLDKTVQVCMTREQAELFKAIGGAKWLRQTLELMRETQAKTGQTPKPFMPSTRTQEEALTFDPVTDIDISSCVKTPHLYLKVKGVSPVNPFVRLFKQKDDSLVSVSVFKGDTLIVDLRVTTPSMGQLVLIRSPMGEVVRHCVRVGTVFFYNAESFTDYPSFEESQVEVIGVVRGHVRVTENL